MISILSKFTFIKFKKEFIFFFISFILFILFLYYLSFEFISQIKVEKSINNLRYNFFYDYLMRLFVGSMLMHVMTREISKTNINIQLRLLHASSYCRGFRRRGLLKGRRVRASSEHLPKRSPIKVPCVLVWGGESALLRSRRT